MRKQDYYNEFFAFKQQKFNFNFYMQEFWKGNRVFQMVDQLAFDSNQNPCNFEYAKIYDKQNFIVSALFRHTRPTPSLAFEASGR